MTRPTAERLAQIAQRRRDDPAFDGLCASFKLRFEEVFGKSPPRDAGFPEAEGCSND